MMLRLAHFSDIHLTLSPFENLWDNLRGKRAAGLLSYTFGGRGRRFSHGAARIAALLSDVDAQHVDHALCTGDVSSTSQDAEFSGLVEVLGQRLQQPQRYTFIPGNHDRYVSSAAGRFDHHFSALGASEYPFSKNVGDFRIVALDAARPTGLANANGLCGKQQLEKFEALLVADRQRPTVVALHYGLLLANGSPDKAHHRLLDYEQVLEILHRCRARVVLVTHGHMHAAFTAPSPQFPIVCAGSATDLHVACGYFIYTLDPSSLHIEVERRQWNRKLQRYEAVDATNFTQAVNERRGTRFPG